MAQKLRSQYDIERILHTLVYPRWEDRPFEEIRRSDLANLLDPAEDEMLAMIRKMMNWYATRNDGTSSPVVCGMHRHGQQKRERWLNDDEIRGLCAARGDMGTFGALQKVLLVTGQQCGKVAKMKWQDLTGGDRGS